MTRAAAGTGPAQVRCRTAEPATGHPRSRPAGAAGLLLGRFRLLGLGRQRADVGQRLFDPAAGEVGRGAPTPGQAGVSAPRAPPCPDRPGPATPSQPPPPPTPHPAP